MPPLDDQRAREREKEGKERKSEQRRIFVDGEKDGRRTRRSGKVVVKRRE